MKVLLDTDVLLWALFDSENLSEEQKALLNDLENDIYVSQISLFEIAIKNANNPKLMPYSPKEIHDVIKNKTDYFLIPTSDSAFFDLNSKMKESSIHDPIYQILYSCANEEKMLLLTGNSVIKAFSEDEIKDKK